MATAAARLEPPPGYRVNPGRQPNGAEGRRVQVILANGRAAKGDWPADTTRWSFTDSPFDVLFFKVIA